MINRRNKENTRPPPFSSTADVGTLIRAIRVGSSRKVKVADVTCDTSSPSSSSHQLPPRRCRERLCIIDEVLKLIMIVLSFDGKGIDQGTLPLGVYIEARPKIADNTLLFAYGNWICWREEVSLFTRNWSSGISPSRSFD